MSTQYIQLKNPSGDLLYPRTDWAVIINRPSFATVEQVLAKQDKLTSANSGPGILIETVEGVLRISATNATNYATLTNKPRINGIELNGLLTAADLGLPGLDTGEGDFEIADNAGNVILRLVEGHVVTKEFDSRDIVTENWLNLHNYINTNNLNTALVANHVVRYNATSSVFAILDNSNNELFIINRTTGAFNTASFNSVTVLTDITNLQQTALTSNSLGAALTNGHYNISIFTNDSGYIHSVDLQNYATQAWVNTQLALKQNTLSAGSGISIVNDIISVTGNFGTYNYNELQNKPSINNVALTGNRSPADLSLPYIAADSVTADFEISDANNNVIARFANGHIQTKEFDSSTLYSDIRTMITSGNYVSTEAMAAAIANAHPNYWGNYAYPTTATIDTPVYILGTTNGNFTPFWFPYSGGGGGGSTYTAGAGISINASTISTNVDTHQFEYINSTTALSLQGFSSATIGQIPSKNSAGNIAWITPFTNPMNSVGDLICGGTNGTPTRLGAGPNGSFLIIKSGTPTWSTTSLIFSENNRILKSVQNNEPIWSSQVFINERAGTSSQQGQYMIHAGTTISENETDGGVGMLRLARYKTRILFYPKTTTDESVTDFKTAYYTFDPDIGSTSSTPAQVLSSLVTNVANQLALFTGTTTLKGIALANYFTLTTSNDITTLSIDTSALGLQGTAIKSGVSGGYATSGHVLTADGSGNSYWSAVSSPGSAMVNPMTDAGDIIYGTTNGEPARLGITPADQGKVLTVLANGLPYWSEVQHNFTGSTSGSGVVLSIGTNQLSSSAATTNNDVLYWNNGPVWGKIPPNSIIGASTTNRALVTRTTGVTWDSIYAEDIASGTATSGQVLTATGSGGASWSTLTALTNPMTQSGDLIIGGTNGAPTRLANNITKSYLAGVEGSVYWTSILGIDIKSASAASGGTNATAGYVLTADGNGGSYWGASGGTTYTAGIGINISGNNVLSATFLPHKAFDALYNDNTFDPDLDPYLQAGCTLQLSDILTARPTYSNGNTYQYQAIENNGIITRYIFSLSDHTYTTNILGPVATNLLSGTATHMQVLQADGNGRVYWDTLQTNASLEYKPSETVNGSINSFGTLRFSSNITSIALTIYVAADDGHGSYAWEPLPVTLTPANPRWVNEEPDPQNPDPYYTEIILLDNTISITAYGEDYQIWGTTSDDPETYLYAFPDYVAVLAASGLSIAQPPTLSTFTIHQAIIDTAVIDALNARAPIYIEGSALNHTLNAGVQSSVSYLFNASYTTTGINYVCLIKGQKWISLNYVNNAFITYEMHDLSPKLYLHTLTFSDSSTNYTLRYIDKSSSAITTFAELQTHQDSYAAHLVHGLAWYSSGSVVELLSVTYSSSTVTITQRGQNGTSSAASPITSFSNINDSVEAWSC